jgi:L-type amino acid transporter 9
MYCYILFQVFGDRILGVMNFIIPVGVAISTFGSSLTSQFSTARLCYVAGIEGHMIEVFSYIHMRRLTPAPAVVLQVSNPINCNGF